VVVPAADHDADALAAGWPIGVRQQRGERRRAAVPDLFELERAILCAMARIRLALVLAGITRPSTAQGVNVPAVFRMFEVMDGRAGRERSG